MWFFHLSMNFLIHFAFFTHITIQVAVSQRLVVKDKEQIVKLNDEAHLLCESDAPLESCLFELPSKRIMSLRSGKGAAGFMYYGGGLEKGHCGLKIQSVTDSDNGEYTCTVTISGDLDSQKASMSMIVAKAPMKPELNLVVPPYAGSEENYYKEGDIMFAVCRVNQGRPTANISWFIGDEKITEGLQMAEIEEYETAKLSSVQQNFTRKVVYTDHGKALKCVAEHPLLATTEMNTTSVRLNVLFPPKPLPVFKQFGLVEGEEGRITVVIPANPKPAISWNIDNKIYYEGDDSPNHRFNVLQSTESTEKGFANWESTLVIKALTKEDVDLKYSVKAENRLGSQTYDVVISTSLKPEVTLGFGMILTIVIGLLLVVIVASVLVFARAKGRWCFSGAANDGEPSVPEKMPPTSVATGNGGKDNPAVLHHGSSDYINTPDVKKPKEDTAV